MPSERPEFVYLDMGNVIFSFDRERAFRQMVAVSGGDLETIRTVAMDPGLHDAIELGAIDWPAFHERFSRLTGTTSDPRALARAASDMFALKVDMLPVLAGLARSGCGLGILSNTCGPHWEHLLARRYAILPGNFREIVLSHEVRAAKPQPEIYRLATERAGVPPERIFFCDDVPAHVAAARSAGWQAEQFTSASELLDQLDRRGLKLGL